MIIVYTGFFQKKTPPQNGVELNFLGKTRLLHNQANQSTVVENHTTLFERTVVTDSLLPNGELIVCHQVELRTSVRIHSNGTHQRVTTTIQTN